MTKNKYLYLIILFVLFTSCQNYVYKKNKTIKNNTWFYKDSVIFNVNIKNNKDAYNVYLDINNTEKYKYSNIFLQINLKSPKGKVITDTVDVILADFKGKWFGNKNNDYYEGHYLFRKNVGFQQKGTYTFSIKHIMRDDSLKGIKKIGVSIHKTE